jgi:SNF2-related domain
VWESYIEQHVNLDYETPILVVRRYAGERQQEAQSSMVLNQADIVLVSYDVLFDQFAQLYSKNKKEHSRYNITVKAVMEDKSTFNIFTYRFYRVVLDEGKYAKMQQSEQSLSPQFHPSIYVYMLACIRTFRLTLLLCSLFCCAFHCMPAHQIRCMDESLRSCLLTLRMSRGLCLTERPFVDHPEDIYQLGMFLDLEPFRSLTSFEKHIMAHFRIGSVGATKALVDAVEYVSLRRTKAMVRSQVRILVLHHGGCR